MKMRMTFLSVLALAALSMTAYAAPVLDQSQETESGTSEAVDILPRLVAQTFTPGLSGILHSVELALDVVPPATGNGTISIVNTVGGAPSDAPADLLGSVPISTAAAEWTTVNFLAQAITLAAGTQYAIVAEAATDDRLSWRTKWDGPNAYTAGAIWQKLPPSSWQLDDFSTGGDAKFRTYMDGGDPAIAEPGALGLIGLALLATRKKRN